jgi:hypothetical protein
LLPAQIEIIGVTFTNPCVVQTADNHNLQTGMTETISGVVGTGRLVDPTLGIGSRPWLITKVDETHFSIPFDNTPLGTYVSGGLVLPNPIVEEVTVSDWPDHYAIQFVIPPAQTTAIVATWKTDSPNYISPAAVASVASAAILAYVNAIPCGTQPLSIYELENAFLDAADPVLPRETVVSLEFDISLDGVGVLPEPGTGVIWGDQNSYFSLDPAAMVVVESMT